MTDDPIEQLTRTRQAALRHRLGKEIQAARLHRGLSLRDAAAGAGIDRRWLARAETGDANLTLDAVAAIATVLGTTPSIRLYQATGARLHDHIQARLLSALIERLHPRWLPRLEVPVYRPSRGVIDLVLVERRVRQLVSTEAHSVVASAERQLRWAALKTDALPSASGYRWGARDPAIRRLLVLRSSEAVRDTVQTAAGVFAAAYPGDSRRATRALTGANGTLDEDTILWVDVRGAATRLLDGPPRGVTVGR